MTKQNQTTRNQLPRKESVTMRVVHKPGARREPNTTVRVVYKP